MKDMLKSAVAGAIAAAFVASVAVAQQAPGQGVQGRGGRGPGGPGGPGGRMGAVILQDLTEEQRQQIRAIHQEQRKDGPPADANLRRDLEAELLADTANDQKLEDLKQQILAAEAANLSRFIDVQKRVAQVLTAEQRAKARERLAQGPPQGGRRAGERRGGRVRH